MASSITESQLNPLRVLASCSLCMDFARLEHSFFTSFFKIRPTAETTCFWVFLSLTHSRATETVLPLAKRFPSFLRDGVRDTTLGLVVYPIVIYKEEN